jgi:hypothetical protein
MSQFDHMNETDVREKLVRPFLVRLGYEHGTEANIRTEQTFRYEKAFLGRKNPKKDPALVGRADYILEIASVGRWVVEVKAPTEKLSRDVVEQAHTYAAHPEVAALFFLITNGRSFHLYRTSHLDVPLMAWEWEETDEVFLAVSNLISPEAIRRKVNILQPDKGKPLGSGVPSEVTIMGGFVRYEDHVSNHRLLDVDSINGLELPVTGGLVNRSADGRLYGIVKVAKAAPLAGELSDLLEREDGYDFYSSDEYISVDRDKPTIFQNFIKGNAPAGTMMSVPGLGKFPAPFDMRFAATTDAIGFVDGDTFMGTMQLSYEFFFDNMPVMIRTAIEAQFGPLPSVPRAQGGGTFEVKLLTI